MFPVLFAFLLVAGVTGACEEDKDSNGPSTGGTGGAAGGSGAGGTPAEDGGLTNDGGEPDGAAQDDAAGGPDGGGELDISVCAPENGPFSTEIDNPYWPMPAGRKLDFEGLEGDTEIHLVITFLDETVEVAGVTTLVLEEREEEDGELIEVSRNFFAQAPDGTVCYFGEDVDIYENGKVVSHEGQWRAGEDDNLPGIMMPADPAAALGMDHAQEVAPGIAEDHGEIVAVGEPVEVPAGSYQDTVRVREWTPLEPGQSHKVYARGVGLIVDDVVELISIEN